MECKRVGEDRGESDHSTMLARNGRAFLPLSNERVGFCSFNQCTSERASESSDPSDQSHFGEIGRL